MNQKRLKRIIIIAVVLIITYFVAAFSITKDTAGHQYRIFSDIEALEILNEYTVSEIKEDNHLGGLSPLEDFTYKVKWGNKNFDVYAYVFENNLQCMQYVKNRKMSYYDEESWHLRSNVFFSTEYIVYSSNRVLYIDGPGNTSFYEFLDFIEQGFDITIK